jgi:hypothetical protein
MVCHVLSICATDYAWYVLYIYVIDVVMDSRAALVLALVYLPKP